MQIEFTELMNTNFTLEKFMNKTFIDIFVTPISDDHEYTERNINLTWEANSFANRTLLVQLLFENALHISSLEKYDNITFQIINQTDIFLSLSGLRLDFEFKNLTRKLKKQMIKSDVG